MPVESQIDFGPVPPLVIGVTGVMEFVGDDREIIRRAVKKFLWQFVDHKSPTGATEPPIHPDWRPLHSTPIALLSSLAPGADLLVAEVAEELEAEYQRLHSGNLAWKFKVFAPMPFPLEQFRRASTFTGSRGTPEDRQKAVQRLEKLDAEHRAFFVPLKEDHESCDRLPQTRERGVTQAELVRHRQQCLEDRLNADLLQPSRYRLRYRAAGEYIAAHSHLLLVLNEQVFGQQPTPDEVLVPVVSELTGNDFPYGSRLILQLKRQGITPELLRSEVAFTWADSGPVVHFFTRKSAPPDGTSAAPPSPPAGTMTVLYPVDTRTREGAQSDTDADWQQEAGARFGTVLDQLDGFNREWAAYLAKTRMKEVADRASGKAVRGIDQVQESELANMLTLPAAVLDANAPAPILEYRRGLDRLARARRRASDLADRVYSDKWKRFLYTLFVLTLLAALLVHVAGHWHTHAATKKAPKKEEAKAAAADPAHPPASADAAGGEEEEHNDDPSHWNTARWFEVWVKALLVLAAAALLGVAYTKFLLYKGSRHEDYRFDFRALSEGVRVQAYWAAAGLAQSVPANYMQRQRNEMVWIRRAITALAAPYTRWADGFAALTESDQLTVLKSIVARWVRWDESLAPTAGNDKAKVEEEKRKAQAGYMERAAFEDHRAEHFWKRFGFDLTLMGLIHLVLWVAGLFNPALFSANAVHAWLAVPAVLLLGGYIALWVWGRKKAEPNVNPPEHHHGFPKAYRWRRQKDRWGAWRGGFVWAREVVYPYAYLWDLWGLERRLPKGMRQLTFNAMRWANVLLVVLLCTFISFQACVWLGALSRLIWIPAADVWWAIAYGSLLLAGALSIAWPERNAMAEHSRQYESMWAMFQAAGRRLLGHLRAAEEELNKPEGERDLARFRGRVKAIQELLYHIGLQALDENAEWLILHRSRPLEPLMAG